MYRRTTVLRSGLALVASTLVLTACSDTADDGAGADGSLRIAVLAASSQNGFNQAVYQGVEEAAEESDVDVTLQLLDGQFDSNTQLSQLQNVTTSGDYDGVIVVPNDGPALAAAFPLANDVPVVSVLNPIGPDIDEMEPQVEGVISTVAVPPSTAAARQAEDVVAYCADLDPCQVVLVLGLLNTPLDVARRDAYQEVLGTESNIEIVATVEGGYDRDQSLSAVTNVLQANRDVDVILSNADQQTSGAQIALENAGIEPSDIYLTGGGGTQDAIAAVREGSWQSVYINFPVTWGRVAFEQLKSSLDGGDVDSWVDADTVGPVEPYATRETLEAAPDFAGEWNG